MKTLIKIDPKKRMYRWYAVGIQNTLLDGIAVIYGWGSLKSTFQHWRTVRVNSEQEAEMLAKRILATRLKKGYSLKMKIFEREQDSPRPPEES
jgi:predicted DNA-binding WGR domain protein